MFEDEIPNEVAKFITKLDLRYRALLKLECKQHIELYSDFLSKEILASGPKRKTIWETGWAQNLSDVLKKGVSNETLLPYYYKNNGTNVMRYQNKFILPEDKNFTTKFLSIIQLVLSKKYFQNFDNIYELGSGPCHNVFEFALKTKHKNFFVTDWVSPVLEIANLIDSNKTQLGLETHTFRSNIFNLFKPNKMYELRPNSIALTFGSMEQLGEKFGNLLDYFLTQKCKNFIHIEPIMELYNRDNEIDNLAFLYAKKRNYLIGFLPKLLNLQERGIIKIHCCNKMIGNGFHDGWTFLRWEKLI